VTAGTLAAGVVLLALSAALVSLLSLLPASPVGAQGEPAAAAQSQPSTSMQQPISAQQGSNTVALRCCCHHAPQESCTLPVAPAAVRPSAAAASRAPAILAHNCFINASSAVATRCSSNVLSVPVRPCLHVQLNFNVLSNRLIIYCC
jgi:hypothetical protein